MKIYQRQLEECYRKLEQAGQVGQTRELRVSLGKVGDIDDLAQRHHIF